MPLTVNTSRIAARAQPAAVERGKAEDYRDPRVADLPNKITKPMVGTSPPKALRLASALTPRLR